MIVLVVMRRDRTTQSTLRRQYRLPPVYQPSPLLAWISRLAMSPAHARPGVTGGIHAGVIQADPLLRLLRTRRRIHAQRLGRKSAIMTWTWWQREMLNCNTECYGLPVPHAAQVISCERLSSQSPYRPESSYCSRGFSALHISHTHIVIHNSVFTHSHDSFNFRFSLFTSAL